MSHIFYSISSLLIALFFVLLGVISVMLPWFPLIRNELIRFILEDPLILFFFGFAFILIGLAIVIHIALNARRRYYHVQSGPRSISIDENVIQDYLNSYWQQLFPQAQVLSKLSLKNNKIYVIADLPYIPQDQQTDVLDRIKNDLADLFIATFGYREQFYLTATFQPPSQEKPAP